MPPEPLHGDGGRGNDERQPTPAMVVSIKVAGKLPTVNGRRPNPRAMNARHRAVALRGPNRS